MTMRGWLACGLLMIAACKSGKDPATLAPIPSDPELTRARTDSTWEKGLYDFRKGNFHSASEVFQRVLLEFVPGDPRIPQAHFYLGESYFGVHSQLQAVREFRRVADEFPTSPLAPDALYRAGDAYADLWRKPQLDPTYGQSALATYTELLNRYPDSPAAAKARVQVTDLRNKFAYKEWENARYYLRNKAADAAILYMKSLVATYPDSPSAELALVQLVNTYRALGYVEDAEEMCGALRQYHPDTKDLAKLCPAAGG
ncbi:MAG TPA: outer membrane protein assembly factor BamD [Gemmatimonadales bacterium]|nr:outer membrane protein assembly factor BamD [Gemmatimonadales bacterium]